MDISRHYAEGVTQTDRIEEELQDFQEIEKGYRIFKGIGRVDIEKAATISAQFITRLRGDQVTDD